MRKRCLRVAFVSVWLGALAWLLTSCGGTKTTLSTSGTGDDYQSVGSALGSGIGSRLLKWTGQQLAIGAVQAAGFYGVTALLNTIFSKDDGQDELKSGMADCQRKLDQVINDLHNISNQLDSVLAAINKARNDIEALNQELAIKDAIDTIQSDYDNLQALAAHDADDNPNNNSTPAQANELKDTIISTAKHDIPLQLDHMHSGMIGGIGSGQGCLNKWTDQMEDSYKAGKPLQDCYQTLESYFSELLGVEAKGLILVNNALKLQANQGQGRSGRYVGTDQDFEHDKFWPHISAQCQVFAQCVDRMATWQAAPNRSGFVTKPDDVAKMYSRADWLLAQATEFCPADVAHKWQYGLHVHVLFDQYRAEADFSHTDQPETDPEVRWQPAASSGSRGRGDRASGTLLTTQTGWAKLNDDRVGRKYPTQEYVDYRSFNNNGWFHFIRFDNNLWLCSYDDGGIGAGDYQVSVNHASLMPCQTFSYSASCRAYNKDFQQVAAGTDDSKVHGTVVVDWRIHNMPFEWQKTTDEKSGNTWKLSSSWAGAAGTNEMWGKILAEPGSNPFASSSLKLVLKTSSDFRTGANKDDQRIVQMAFDFKTTNKSSQQSRVTSELAMQEFGSIDLSGNQSDWATRTMQTKVRDGAPYQPQLTLTGTSASNQRATTYSIETHITNIRLYVP